MAGRGTAPKRPDERHDRRPNDFETLPAEGYQGEFPKLPATYMQRAWDGEKHVEKRVRFLPTTRAWYDDWAHSPMAVEFTQVHWLRLQSIAKLQDRFDRGDMTVSAELRQGLANFGGTPMDVRRLGRVIERNASPASGEQKPAKAASSSRRARLEVVK